MPEKKDYSWLGAIVVVVILMQLSKTSSFRSYIRELSEESSKELEIIRSIDISVSLLPDSLNLTVTNQSPWSFKNIVIECAFSAQSGTVLVVFQHDNAG